MNASLAGLPSCLQPSRLHDVLHGDAQRLDQTGQRQHRHIVVASLDPPYVAAIHFGEQRELFLGNALLDADAPDGVSERDEDWVLAIFREIWHPRMVSL